jgi:hypothetical protein
MLHGNGRVLYSLRLASTVGTHSGRRNAPKDSQPCLRKYDEFGG